MSLSHLCCMLNALSFKNTGWTWMPITTSPWMSTHVVSIWTKTHTKKDFLVIIRASFWSHNSGVIIEKKIKLQQKIPLVSHYPMKIPPSADWPAFTVWHSISNNPTLIKPRYMSSKLLNKNNGWMLSVKTVKIHLMQTTAIWCL